MRHRGRIYDSPPPIAFEAVISSAVVGVRQGKLFRDEGVAGEVLGRTHGRIREGHDVAFDNAIMESVNHRVNSKREDMLVVVCVDMWCDSRAERVGFIRVFDIDL